MPLDPEAESYPSDFAIRATFTYTDGTTSETTRNIAHFNPWVDSTVNWQYAATAVVADKDYSSIKVELIYDYNANTVLFDGIQLYKEEFGSSYTYDDEGNVIAVKDLQAQTTEYEYTNNDLTAQILPTGAKLTYDYDDYHNVKSATSGTGVVYNFAYDDYGNNTSVSIVSGDTSITSTAAYTTDGNRLSSTTDAAGKTTTYSYDENTNVLHWVRYPEDTEVSRTQYTYDTMYRLATAQAAVDGTTSPLTASYTYEDDLLTKIQTGSTTYSFSYGDFALRSSIQIGSQTLAEYTYTTDKNNYLSRLDYGNADSVNYTYDDYGRVTSQTYEDGDTVTYTYDNSGALAKVTDSATGITTTYYYDFTDRLLRYEEESTTLSHTVGYGYDTINNLTSLVETINGVTHTTSYEYDDDNRITKVISGDTSKSYTYDAYSRVTERTTKHGETTVFTDEITFYAPSGTATTGQISMLRYVLPGGGLSYSYTYDDNGNILSVAFDNEQARPVIENTSYVYETANQLIRESNSAAGKTWVWTYDNAGNILSRTEYDYLDTDLTTPLDTVTYSYADSDSDWGDLLTGYDGNTITSDKIGNMLSDGTWTYTWEHGRQLASMTDGTTTWNYTYNSNGLRTSRSNGTTTYSYIYNGSQLTQMTVTTAATSTTDAAATTDTLYFAYDASGIPMTVTYNDTVYYYVTNIQGDVVAILNSSGNVMVNYAYDAWGNIVSVAGQMAATLGAHNPLRYRGYVYDTETELYYLQSRYYNPKLGRFISSDVLVYTGQGILGNNMFAYCRNNPVIRADASGASDICVIDNDDESPFDDLGYTPGGGGGGDGYTYGASFSTSTYSSLYTGGFYNNGYTFYGYNTNPTVSACFVAGTLVQSEEGTTPIEKITVGDKVWAWDEATGDVALKEVVETYINETDELIHVFVNGEEIVTTPTHPFYSPVKGWTEACKLRAGDVLVLVSGENVVVEKIQHEILEVPVPVYNFQVEDYHTYYVTRTGVLVHNSCQKAGDTLLPDEYWMNKKAPDLGIPNSSYTNVKYNFYTGELEYSTAYYDIGGRQSMRIDWTNHGYSDHGNPHIHFKIFNAQYPMGIKERMN